jgi:hypothetical protein
MIESVYDPKKLSRHVPTRHVAEGDADGGAERAQQQQQQCRLCLVLRVRGGLVLIGEGAPAVFGQLLLGGQELAVTVRTPFDSEVDTTSLHVALRGFDLSYAGAYTSPTEVNELQLVREHNPHLPSDPFCVHAFR